MKENHAGGRPPKYKTAKEMQKVIDKYFESCFRPVRIFVKEFNKYMTLTDDKGEIMKEQYRPFTITGLADSLDMSRETLLRYGENDEFSDTIMREKYMQRKDCMIRRGQMVLSLVYQIIFLIGKKSKI